MFSIVVEVGVLALYEVVFSIESDIVGMGVVSVGSTVVVVIVILRSGSHLVDAGLSILKEGGNQSKISLNCQYFNIISAQKKSVPTSNRAEPTSVIASLC